MKRLPALAGLMVLIGCAWPLLASDRDAAASREALKALNDFIGTWKGSGAPVKPRPTSQELWTETVSWGWRFKSDDAWMVLTVQDGRHFRGGELRYLPGKQRYELTMLDKEGKKHVFEGEVKQGYLKVERADREKKETQRLTMNLAGDGIRLIYLLERKPDGRTLYVKDFQVACTKQGESLGAKAKQAECVVTGGLGTATVSYQGETYYVCCSGCRDAFNENPQKYIQEYKERKAKGK